MNSNERWERIKNIFEEALSRTGGDRRAYLEGACRGDVEMVREVESLLSSFDKDYLEGAAVEEVADAFVQNFELTPGVVVGQYKIVAELGKGGQGAVYRAIDTKLNRTVALKTLPPELNIDETARKRFYREAQLASALDHPNICAIHDMAEVGGVHFIVMQFVDGQNVRDLLGGKPLDLASSLRIGIQVCDALAAAHERGIIHRDIKAHNIVVTPNGTAKVLDFGLAKLTHSAAADQTELTNLGAPYGTPTYAAPEQSRGEKVDHRADVFSTGVLMYELLTGTWAFHGKTAIDVRHAVLHDEPRPIAERRGEELPDELNVIVARALEKEASRRFQSMTEMRDALIAVQRGARGEGSTGDGFISQFETAKPRHFLSPRQKVRRLAAVAAIVILVVGAAAFYLYRRGANRAQAATDALLVNQLARQRRYFEAFDLAKGVLEYLPDDETVSRLMPVISDSLSVKSSETGANVYIRRFAPAQETKREWIGLTPIENLRIARGEYVVEIEKEGFAAVRRTFSGAPEVFDELAFNPEPTSIDVRLLPVSAVPDRMVLVPGGEYLLASWKRPTNEPAVLADFFIDRFEVSNSEFKEFISAGGYVRKDLWTQAFATGSKTIGATSVIKEFKDQTGLPGPRTWVNQTFPEGRGQYPVTDISWYEAAAYATFRGKALPTLYQWEKAARDGAFTHSSNEFMPWGPFLRTGMLDGRANMAGRDTVPVESNEFGMSPFGCLNMAGNVAEWCLNGLNEGFAATGGSWAEPTYAFGSVASYPGTFSSNRLGFRCVKNLAPPGPDAAHINSADAVPDYAVTTPQKFEQLAAFYRYDKTPLDGRVTDITETPDWKRERIEYRGGNDEIAIAYLYLPKNAAAPFQVITYLPAGDVFGRFITVPGHVEAFVAPHVKSGRAVLAVVLAGFLERDFSPGTKPAPVTSVRFRDRLVGQTRDVQRGLDYLADRSDIDLSRVAFIGYSAGAEAGLIFSAIEKRLSVVVYIGAGISVNNARRPEEANIANFAPHIRPPKLLIIGRYDEEYSWPAEGEPLYKLLREPRTLMQYDAGHSPPPEISVPAISKFLDEHLGPVAR